MAEAYRWSMSALRHALSGSARERCFFLWGEVGCGKSHLLQAIIDQARVLGHSANYAQASVPKISQVVAVDDVPALDNAAQIALFQLYNNMQENGGLLLISGPAAPAHLHLRDDLRTRLGWGLVYQVHALNDNEKAQAIEQHAQARGLALPREVTHYLLRHGRRDLPALLALLEALDQHCLQLKRAPSIPLLKEVMHSITLPGNPTGVIE